MIKLFIRNYVLFVIIAAILVAGTMLFVKVTTQSVSNKMADALALGPFSFVQKQLNNRPASDWQPYLNQLQQHHQKQKIQIVSYTQLPQALKNSRLLTTGEIIHFNTYGKDVINPYNAEVAYQRIGTSNQYLSMPIIAPSINDILNNSEWIATSIKQLFAKAPPEQYPRIAKMASTDFNVLITVKPVSNLSKTDQQHLKKWGILAQSFDEDHTQTIGFPIANNQYLVTLNKLTEPWVARHLYSVLALIALLLLLFICWVWSYPFYRNLDKLQQQAQHYGDGDFEYTIRVPKQLALSPLHLSLNKMGGRLQRLMNSHKELTNAIAHEIKTPLSRLRFSLGILKNKYQESDTKDIQSMDEDIEMLDDLVNEILLHAKFDRKGVVLNLQPQSLTALLTQKTAQYQDKYADKQWQLAIESNIKATFDKQALARAIDNLLINAVHYGGDHIKVSLRQRDNIQIIIEDNGLGIDKADYDKIFLPFERLSQSRQKAVRGHGLGLAICQKIITSHQGTLTVAPSDLGGAQFSIELDTIKTI